MPQIVTPNLLGHNALQRSQGAGTESNLELSTRRPDILSMKAALKSAENDAADYFSRNEDAFNMWHSRWEGQTVDGRKWNDSNPEKIFPWEGASDCRPRTTEKLIGQRITVAMFAVMNMKVQAKSVRPFQTIRQGAQGTMLLNWMFFTHMFEDARTELNLAVAWREAYGTSLLEVCWEQMRRLDYVDVTTTDAVDFLNQQMGIQDPNDPNALTLSEFRGMLSDPAAQDGLVQLVQSFSPIITTGQARKVVADLSKLSYATVPIPYVFKSQPRWTALRPMVDIFFPRQTSNLQRGRWFDRCEWVSETDLIDRIETDSYDADFVDKAIDHKGASRTSELWTARSYQERAKVTGRDYDDLSQKIQLHHFYRKAHYKGVPVLERTVFHMDVEGTAKHGPYGYAHGEYPFIGMRREYHDREFLSSRGFAEIAYSTELEIKAQRDFRIDRAELALRPAMHAPYKDVLRLKQTYQPGAVIPESRSGDVRFGQPPQYDPGSIEIDRTLEHDLRELSGLFGQDIDPALLQLRRQELADEIHADLKPALRQTFQLMQQYLPDDEVAQVVGTLARPFQVDRHQIQGAYEISATVDMRELDPEFLKEKLGYMEQLAQMDTMGLIDKSKFLMIGAEAVDYSLADMAIQDQEPASEKEVQEEKQAISRIVGSGLDEALPMGANYSLRKSTLQTTVTEALQSNPAFRKAISANPDVLKVLQNRMKFYDGQLQQQQNKQIGRAQTTATFTKQAPALQA